MSPKTKFEHSIPDYRRRILVALCKARIFPPLCVATLSSALSISKPITIAMSLFSIPVSVYAKSVLSEWSEARAAARMGAKPIPRVRGKWPGNLDVALRMKRSFEKEYAMQDFAELFEEYDCPILNTRLLWSDQNICIDEGIMKFVSTTQFNQFRKGIFWHERLDKLLGTGLFNVDDDAWKKGRALARPFFSRDRVSDMETFERTTITTLSLISHRASGHQPIDVQDLMSRFTFDTACVLAKNSL